MPKHPKDCVACEFFTWNLFDRGGVWYADGRHNIPNLGKRRCGRSTNSTAARPWS
jgi:hypothetical protein